MRRAIRRMVVGGLIAALLACPAVAAPEVGDRAGTLAAPQVDGAAFDLAALHGKVVIVNFWATWCVPCREEMPALDTYYKRAQSRGVALIGLSLDRARDREAVLKAAQAVHYPIAMLSDATSNGFGKPAALPVTYIIDTGGVVRAVLTPDVASITPDSLDKIVGPLLSPKP